MNDSPPLKPAEAEAAAAKKSKAISVNRAWLLEVIGVIGIKRVAEKNNWPNNIMMIAAFFLSFKLLIGAMQMIPLSTAYAVWTGVGT